MAERPTILVVEDEEMLLSVVTLELEDAGFTVLGAETAEEGLRLLREREAIDLLFTDIRLPGRLDGWDLAEQARALHPGLPVVYATGYSTGQPRLVRDGILVMKPYRLSAILKAAHQLGIS